MESVNGTNAAGNAAIPNGDFGLRFNGVISKVTTGNVISGNTGGGMQSQRGNTGAANDIISGNLIGTDATGANPLGNNGIGLILGSGTGNGSTVNQTVTGNTIASSMSHGILVDSGLSLILQNNFIGTNSSLSQTIANGGDGIRFINQFRFNEIGGAGAGNTIAFNTGNGVNMSSTNINSTENQISQNSIYSNGGLGIDLVGNGVTANDNCDGENGVNTLQNYPVISAVSLSGASNVRIVGWLNSRPSQSFMLHFYANVAADASGFGEGQQFIGTASVAVPGGCQANFTATLPRTLANARCISATATDNLGNTSEFSPCVSINPATGDFDSDGLSDLGIFRPSNGQWWIQQSSNNMVVVYTFGASTDKIVPADYDGDGKSDVAFWRPSTGEWFVLRSSNLTFFAVPFGISTDKTAPGDFDGDNKADFAVYRQSTGTWFILKSSDNVVLTVPFGISQDVPVVADYDGDGISDVAIYRPVGGSGNSEWWILRSTAGLFATPFGSSTDKAVQADYTGDGKADVAIWRPSTGQWFVLRSENRSFFAAPFGVTSDIPSPADYDGDGRTDFAVFRPSNGTWFVSKSTGGFSIQQFGASGDIPLPSAFIP